MSVNTPENFPSPENLNKIVDKIKKQGRDNKLTDGQLDDRKNLHWDTVYMGLSWIFVCFTGGSALIAIGLLVLYVLAIYQNPEEVKRVVENAVFALAIAASTLGLEKTVQSFFKRKR